MGTALPSDHYRIHFSCDPDLRLKPYSEEQSPNGAGREYWWKPSGLWFSIEGPDSYGWRWWCHSEDYGTDGFKSAFEVTFTDKAKVVRLDHDDMAPFTRQYGIASDRWDSVDGIDWAKVADEYDAIEIWPYHWEYRLDRKAAWYYPWDVASGCVWNADAIEVRRRPISTIPLRREEND